MEHGEIGGPSSVTSEETGTGTGLDASLARDPWVLVGLGLAGLAVLVHALGGQKAADGIPDSILLKPGPLTPDEMAVMRTHATIGGDTLRTIVEKHTGERHLRMAMEIAYFHHEKWSGGGYPHGLRGEEIPFAARIVALVDAYDAMTSVRPYQIALSHEVAIERILKDRGTRFDPEVVDVFLDCADEIRQLRLQLGEPIEIQSDREPVNHDAGEPGGATEVS